MRPKKKEDKNKEKKRIILYIIIIIIILLSLITSCSCTSKFWGKIGDLFHNEKKVIIDPDTNNQEIIRNKELVFDTNFVEMTLSDSKTKISFSYSSINPEEFTCTTSDAEIATCYVIDNYVLIIPKKEGEITVFLTAKANGKIYEASTKVVIMKENRKILLSETEGTLNLYYQKEKIISYSLIGLTGDITVTSSDESLASATINNGILKITAFQTGEVTITLNIKYNDKTYTASYTLKIIKENTNNATNISNSNNENKNNHQNASKPTDNENNTPEEPKLDSDSSLKSLTTSKGTLEFSSNIYSYTIGVGSWTSKITLEAKRNSGKSQISYIYNGESVSSLKNLKLKEGNNFVKIIVTAEDGNKSIYTVIINRAKSSASYLKELTTNIGNLNPKFSSNILSYNIDVDYNINKISLSAIPKNKKSTLYYTFNGHIISSLTDLELNNGINIVTITVISKDGKTRTYNVTINKSLPSGVLDNNSLLKNLTISNGTLNFNPYLKEYYIGVNNISNISLKAIASSSKAKINYFYNGKPISNLYNIPLKEGDNEIEIIVKAEDNSESKYKVIVNKAPQDYGNTLSNITTSQGILTPTFEKNTLNYNIYVANTIEQITLKAELTKESANLKYVLDGKTIDNLENLPLKPGKNIVKIIVSDKGIERTYTITIHKAVNPLKSHDSSLTNLIVKNNIGTLSPSFSKEIKEYMVEVKSNIDKITLIETLSHQNAKVSYTYNNENLESLENIKLVTGKNNVVVITVVAEDGITSTNYKVTINKLADSSKSSNNLLADLKISKGTLVKESNDTFTVTVDANAKEIDITAIPAHKKAKVLYNKEEKESLTVKLKPGNNQVTITVIAEDGTPRNYTITIYKPVYTINILKEEYTFYLEETNNYQITYTIYDEKNNPTDNYNIEDIKIEGLNTFKGTIKKEKGVITLIPENKLQDLLSQTYKLKITYNEDKEDQAIIKFATYYDYYLNTYKDTYTIDLDSDLDSWDLVLNNNLLIGKVEAKQIENGLRLSTNTSKNVYIDITSNNKELVLKPKDLASPNSLSINVSSLNPLEATIHVKGSVYGQTIEFDVKLLFTKKYLLTIDANGGFIDAFTTIEKIKVIPNTKINLSDYTLYKTDTNQEQNCMYYKLESFNTKKDGTGEKYELKEYTMQKDLYLYAIYEKTSTYMELPEKGKLYLTEVDLFKNEEYYKMYNEYKKIYPGAHGSYVMTIENNKATELTITSMTLEENTICLKDLQGCINMGYIIKYDPDLTSNDSKMTYYYGANKKYTILNIDANNKNDFNNYRNIDNNYSTRKILFAENQNAPIVLKKGEKVEISLLWEWAYDINNGAFDTLDTAIGEYVANKTFNKNINNNYSLTISIDYESKSDHCKTTP